MGVPYAPPYANGHISATGDPIHFMFGYRLGFSGTADLMALFSVRTNAAILNNFEWPYLRNGSQSTYIARIARSIFAIAQLSCSRNWWSTVTWKTAEYVKITTFTAIHSMTSDKYTIWLWLLHTVQPSGVIFDRKLSAKFMDELNCRDLKLTSCNVT